MDMTTEQWHVSYDTNGDDATAEIHTQRDDRGFVCDIATVTNLPCVEIDGEWELCREGEQDADRLRTVCLIVHAPDMLQRLRDAWRQLSWAIDGNGENPVTRHPWEPSLEHTEELHKSLNSERNHELWCYLCEVQDILKRAIEEATDLDTV